MSDAPKKLVVAGGFDDLRAGDFRFLQEAAKLGEVTVWLWPDELVEKYSGKPPRFPLAERQYFLGAVRFVTRVMPIRGGSDADTLPVAALGGPEIWIDHARAANDSRRAFCTQHNLNYLVLEEGQLEGFPSSPVDADLSGAKKVIVTGTFDWLHSGHVRFFEEASELGALYVTVGNDDNIRLLKGEGHPLLPQEQRRYMVGSIRYVHQALIAGGSGWLDAEGEIRRIGPDIYAVNEDGDRGEKQDYCRRNGIEYVVLKRTPAPGLPRRTSTALRGF